MKLEEYKELLSGASDESKVPAILSSVLDNLTQDLTTLDTLRATNVEQEKKIRELQDTNMKLFLAQTGEPEEEKEEPVVTPQSIAEAMFKKGE